MCNFFFFFYLFCFMCPLLDPKIEVVYVHMNTPGNMHFSIGFLYPCENVFTK